MSSPSLEINAAASTRAADAQRQTTSLLSGLDFGLLWAGAAIALSEIWAGGLLAPLGFYAGIAVIILGRLIGNLPMAFAGYIGAVTRAPGMVTTRAALGLRGSYLPAALNVIQLIGWTAVMLWIGGQAAAQLAPDIAREPAPWILAGGALTTLWALAGPRYWRPLQRVSVLLLAALCVWMTIQFVRQYDFESIARAGGSGGMSFMAALDLAIAMPISWMPLAADYARHARNPRTSFAGTFVGYLLGGVWMYALGLAAAIAANSKTPETVLMAMMAESGAAYAALLIVLISTITTTFLDVYSHAVSLSSIVPRIPAKAGIIACGLLGTLFALFMDPTRYEQFLLMIGSAFCPLFGVVFVDYFILSRGRYEPDALWRGDIHSTRGGLHLAGAAAWAVGIAIYQLIALRFSWLGGSLPAMLASGAFYFLLVRRNQTSGSCPTVSS